jgi:protein O-GlcNAc transferase
MSEQESKKLFEEGIEYFHKKDFFLAEEKFEKALKLYPDRTSILENLAIVYFINNRYYKSEDLLNRLIELGADSIKVFNLKFKVLKKLDKIKELKSYINNNLVSKNLDFKYKIIKDFLYPTFFDDQKDIDETREEFSKSLNKLEIISDVKLTVDKDFVESPVFNLSYDQYESLKLNRRIVGIYRKYYPELNQNFVEKNNNEKIKIGFISEFFTNHTIGKLFQGIIFNLDQNKFEVCIFHSEKTNKSKRFEKFKEAEILQNVKNISLPLKFEEKIKLIKKEKLDIVFFPDIGMSTEFYPLSFIRFAKIQFTSWGHGITTGNETIDYFLSSKLLETNGVEKRYSEKVILSEHLPMFFYKPRVSKILKKEELIKKNIYFCSQNLMKVHPHFDEIINKILKTDKKAKVMFIKDKNEVISKKLFERFKKNIPYDYEKIEFLSKVGVDDYINLCGSSSVLLDTLYFGAGNSFHESMLYGTPTVTFPLDNLKSRIVYGAYKQMKIENPPIVNSIDEYIERAVELANLNEKKMLETKNYYSENAQKYLFENYETVKNLEKIFMDIYDKSS